MKYYLMEIEKYEYDEMMEQLEYDGIDFDLYDDSDDVIILNTLMDSRQANRYNKYII